MNLFEALLFTLFLGCVIGFAWDLTGLPEWLAYPFVLIVITLLWLWIRSRRTRKDSD